MFVDITIFWFLRTLKYVLFWIYLWQLKEYHTGRFLDHFRTYKGKKIFLNGLIGFKLVLAVLFLFGFENFFILALALVYFIELLFFLRGILKKSLKKPVFTQKTLFLILVSLAIVIVYPFVLTLYINSDSVFCFGLLFFDILTPVITSLIVFLFQPFFVLARNRIINKARKKIKGFKNLIVIGITGSYGKTSTKEFLSEILSEKFTVLKTKEHQNSEIGISQCILNDLKPNHEIFIVEMGSYGKGGIKLLCDIVKPKIGIVTGVNEQHLALFGNFENLLSAEGGRELLSALPKEGLLIVNGENKYCRALYEKAHIQQKKIYTKKKEKTSALWTEDIEVEKDSVSFIAMTKNKEMAHFRLNILGKQNIQNILAAILVARELGMNMGEISKACENITQWQAGMVFKKGKHGIAIIDSSYSSNPDGVLADLDYLSIYPKKRVIIMPCLIELGLMSSKIHQKIGKKIGEVCDLAVITSRDRFEEIKKGFIGAGGNAKNILLCDNPHEIYAKITTFCTKGDAVLLEGRVPQKLVEILVISY